MNRKLTRPVLVLCLMFGLVGCSTKKPPPSDAEQKSAEGKTEEEQKETAKQAETRIKDWLGKDLTKKMSSVGKELGRDLQIGC